jgi:ribosomal protein S18 acetylase RimI-like enzyme
MDSPAVSLHPMSDDEFAEFVVWAVRDYAAQNTATGRWAPEDALRFAKGEYLLALPNGLQTQDSYLYTVRDARSGERVGSLMLTLRLRGGQRETFVYNIVVDEAKRGLGYGRAMMMESLRWAREQGSTTVGLHVFGHNTVARELYASLGFRETSVSMQLDLPASDDQ